MKLLQSPAQYRQSVCLSAPVHYMRLAVLQLFTFSQSHPPPPPLCIQLFVPAAFVGRLFISGPSAASVLEYEIVMVIVIFYEGDKRA